MAGKGQAEGIMTGHMNTINHIDGSIQDLTQGRMTIDVEKPEVLDAQERIKMKKAEKK